LFYSLVSHMTKLFVVCGVLAALVGIASSNAFRGSSLHANVGHMSVAALRAAMLDELMAALGSGNRVTERRLQSIEAVLSPIFKSLPKNAHGNLEHSAVRYVLHRVFVLRHGMYVKGLEPGGEAWNVTASPTEVLDDKVPSFIQAMFEERLNGKGLGIHEVAILAATLEHLIHDEALERLKVSYEANSFSMENRLNKESTAQVIDTYMVLFVLGQNITGITNDEITSVQAKILRVYPAWPESQKFSREVQDNVTLNNAAGPEFAGGLLSFNATAQIVEEIGERYGRWQDSECKDLKGALLKLEDPGTGRVLLKNFYSNALDGAWQFTESVAYLRELGALDETDPQRMSVIIPNYINSRSNCLASSSVYSVCCLNECEALLGHLEKEIGEPDGSPERMIELVSNLPSSTMQAPRSISSDLKGLLEEVASHHQGRVPLHGRLFGQWMHHAYPRECTYPHKAGTTNPMSADQWMDEKGIDALTASEAEMAHHMTDRPTGQVSGLSQDAKSRGKSLMWSVEEELVVSATGPTGCESIIWSRGTVLMAFLSLCVGVVRTLWPTIVYSLNRNHMLPMSRKTHYC